MSDDKREEVGPAEDQDTQPLRIDEVVDEAIGARRRAGGVPGDDDDEDETWTNQPTKGKEQDDFSEDSTDEDEADEEELEAQPAARKVIKTGRDVLCDALPERAERAKVRLKPYVAGTIVFELINSGERFLFDWRGDLPQVSPVVRETLVSCDESLGVVVSPERLNVDAIISISEQNLMAIRLGDLNPQVGMLTDKIRVKGKIGPCVYIFNLIAPRPRA